MTEEGTSESGSLAGWGWLYECFLKEVGRLHLSSKDSNAVFVSISLVLAGAPGSPEPGFSEAQVITRVSCRSWALVRDCFSPGHAQKTACFPGCTG